MNDSTQCPIWNTVASILDRTNGTALIESARAGGRYWITGTAEATVKHVDDQTRARLSTWIIDRRLQGIDPPRVTSEDIDAIKSARPIPVMKRADRLLKYFAMSSKHIGELVHCLNGTPTVERAFAWSESLNGEEVRFLVNLLTEEGWIVHQLHSGGFDVRVLAGGYIHLDNVAAQFSASVQGFVAMWFDDSMSSVYLEGMSPGIEDAGYSPMRIDRKHHNNKIDDEIIAEIRRSRFLVADFTHGDAGARGGVYYEAGFAHGLSIPVIFTIRADMLTHAHFDTRQYSHILWKDATDLRKQLADRISATIGDGPMKPEPS